jgi:hypothetical protein
MYGNPAMTCLKFQVYLHVWFRNHHIFECYTLSGYRVSTMSIQTAPTPTTITPPPPYGSITFTHLEEISCMVIQYML